MSLALRLALVVAVLCCLFELACAGTSAKSDKSAAASKLRIVGASSLDETRGAFGVTKYDTQLKKVLLTVDIFDLAHQGATHDADDILLVWGFLAEDDVGRPAIAVSDHFVVDSTTHAGEKYETDSIAAYLGKGSGFGWVVLGKMETQALTNNFIWDIHFYAEANVSQPHWGETPHMSITRFHEDEDGVRSDLQEGVVVIGECGDMAGVGKFMQLGKYSHSHEIMLSFTSRSMEFGHTTVREAAMNTYLLCGVELHTDDLEDTTNVLDAVSQERFKVSTGIVAAGHSLDSLLTASVVGYVLLSNPHRLHLVLVCETYVAKDGTHTYVSLRECEDVEHANGTVEFCVQEQRVDLSDQVPEINGRCPERFSATEMENEDTGDTDLILTLSFLVQSEVLVLETDLSHINDFHLIKTIRPDLKLAADYDTVAFGDSVYWLGATGMVAVCDTVAPEARCWVYGITEDHMHVELLYLVPNQNMELVEGDNHELFDFGAVRAKAGTVWPVIDSRGRADYVMELDCPPGSFYLESEHACHECPKGQYKDARHTYGPCILCPAGTYSDTKGATGSHMCKNCTMGDTNSTLISKCSLGAQSATADLDFYQGEVACTAPFFVSSNSVALDGSFYTNGATSILLVAALACLGVGFLRKKHGYNAESDKVAHYLDEIHKVISPYGIEDDEKNKTVILLSNIGGYLYVIIFAMSFVFMSIFFLHDNVSISVGFETYKNINHLAMAELVMETPFRVEVVYIGTWPDDASCSADAIWVEHDGFTFHDPLVRNPLGEVYTEYVRNDTRHCLMTAYVPRAHRHVHSSLTIVHRARNHQHAIQSTVVSLQTIGDEESTEALQHLSESDLTYKCSVDELATSASDIDLVCNGTMGTSRVEFLLATNNVDNVHRGRMDVHIDSMLNIVEKCDTIADDSLFNFKVTDVVCEPCTASTLLLTKVDETDVTTSGENLYYSQTFFNVTLNIEQELIYRTASIQKVVATFGGVVVFAVLAALGLKDIIGIFLSAATLCIKHVVVRAGGKGLKSKCAVDTTTVQSFEADLAGGIAAASDLNTRTQLEQQDEQDKAAFIAEGDFIVVTPVAEADSSPSSPRGEEKHGQSSTWEPTNHPDDDDDNENHFIVKSPREAEENDVDEAIAAADAALDDSQVLSQEKMAPLNTLPGIV